MGPILAAVVAFALASGGIPSALLAFLLFGATMATLMLAAALLVGLSDAALLRRVRASGLAVQRVASVILVGVGLLLVYSVLQAEQFRRLLFP